MRTVKPTGRWTYILYGRDNGDEMAIIPGQQSTFMPALPYYQLAWTKFAHDEISLATIRQGFLDKRSL